MTSCARPWAALVALLCVLLPSAANADSPKAAGPAAAPDFALHATVGPNVRLSEEVGKVVVLVFWSSRCNTCRAALAELDSLASTYGSAGFTVFGVNLDDDQKAAREFAASLRVKFPLLLDPSKRVAKAYRVDVLPMAVAVDRLGRVRGIRRDNSPKQSAQWLATLRKLLDE